MKIPSVTRDHIRELRTWHPSADLIYVGADRMVVDGPHNDVIDGVYLCSSHWLDGLPRGLTEDDAAHRMSIYLKPTLEELVAKEHAELFVQQLNTYRGDHIWDLIENHPDFDRRLPQEYPHYVHSEYDRRQYDLTATTAEFVGCDGLITFLLDHRDRIWHAEYTGP